MDKQDLAAQGAHIRGIMTELEVHGSLGEKRTRAAAGPGNHYDWECLLGAGTRVDFRRQQPVSGVRVDGGVVVVMTGERDW